MTTVQESSRARVRVAVVAGLLALAAVLASVPHTLPWGTANRVVAVAPVAAPVPGGQTSPERADSVTDLLDRRARAVVGHVRSAYLQTETPGARTPSFARLAVLPFVRWSYALGTPTSTSTDTIELAVTLTTRLSGETADATVGETLTLTRTGSGWRVSAERTRGPRAQLWELGALRVVRGRAALVVGVDTAVATLRQYASLADRVVPQVTRVWGTSWSRYAVVVVTRSTAQLGRALGRSASSLADFAAVTTAEGEPSGSGHVADRVWTNTTAMAGLSALGREIVLRHELTHVATYAPERSDAPLWLVEGVAEYTGYRGSGIAVDVALGDLLALVRSGHAPAHLPSRAEFDGAHVAVAYESAHLACLVLAQEYGAPALVRVYRLTVTGPGSPQADLDAALRAVTGRSLAWLEKTWHARAAALAAG